MPYSTRLKVLSCMEAPQPHTLNYAVPHLDLPKTLEDMFKPCGQSSTAERVKVSTLHRNCMTLKVQCGLLDSGLGSSQLLAYDSWSRWAAEL